MSVDVEYRENFKQAMKEFWKKKGEKKTDRHLFFVRNKTGPQTMFKHHINIINS